MISWSGDNYCAASGEVDGLVIVTGKTIEGVEKDFKEAFSFHLEDEDSIDNYVFCFELQVSALLHKLDGILTRSALSRVTGINEKQLSHYMTGLRNPRKKQRDKIVEGIHLIGKEFIGIV